ncbi:MAG TPA: zinc ribbon domain-containing protein [Abditibacteriaceae bacterium]|jgi:putative FmdB family regulatory protein
MPIYEYIALTDGCALCDGRFEEIQSASDEPFTECPACEAPCQRVISRPARAHVNRSAGGELLSNDNIARNGFLKYERSGDNTWTRTAGDDSSGPPTLERAPK